MIAAFLSVVILITFQVAFVATMFEGCDLTKTLAVNETHVFESANYTATNIHNRYEAGSSCRLHITAPQGYFIRLAGRILLDKKTHVFTCIGQGQKFLISRDGMKDFYQADIFCSVDTISVDSVSNEMTLGYMSDKGGAGRFHITAKAVKFTKDNCDCGWGYYSFTKQYSSALFRGFTSIVGLYHIEKDEVLCTGAIISSNYIVTSAQCLQNITEPKTALNILAGYRSFPSDDYPQYQTSYTIESVKIHEKYNSTSPAQLHDIALIKVTSGIKFSRGVSPVCLPTRKFFIDENFYKWRSFDLVAWSKYNNDGAEQNLLNATVTSQANVDCSKSFKKFSLTNNQLCTYMKNTTIKYPENPGGALIHTITDRKVLVGIFNMNVEHTQPVVYSRVATYVQWIKNATATEFLCSRLF